MTDAYELFTSRLHAERYAEVHALRRSAPFQPTLRRGRRRALPAHAADIINNSLWMTSRHAADTAAAAAAGDVPIDATRARVLIERKRAQLYEERCPGRAAANAAAAAANTPLPPSRGSLRRSGEDDCAAQ